MTQTSSWDQPVLCSEDTETIDGPWQGLNSSQSFDYKYEAFTTQLLLEYYKLDTRYLYKQGIL